MNWLGPILLFLCAFVAVFVEASFDTFRNLTGTQFDLLPPLMVYAALTHGMPVLTALAVLSGLWFDSLSANPPGVTILPLFLVGLTIHQNRDFLLRENSFAQWVLGAGASAFVPALSVVILLNTGTHPLVGWASLWPWLIVTVTGAAATPVLFVFFDRVNRALTYQRAAESSFRPDREIKRGRS